MRLFSREKQAPAAPAKEEGPKVNLALAEAIKSSLDKMQREGVERIVLSIHEHEFPRAEGFVGVDSRYYPEGILDREELDLIKAGKSYRVIELVCGDVGGQFKRRLRGVHVVDRERISERFLARLVRPIFNTKGTYLFEGDEAIQAFTKNVPNWTSEMLTQRVEEGIREYRELTANLIADARGEK